ncbi:YopX family protein [Brevibacillus fluminis]|uniref:YopX family protein n=1 Tax=Brevibacillus fluminis TaxID=511487 RepID=UPI003F8A231B
MMQAGREIKFRGKCIADGELNGKWVYGDLIQKNGKAYIAPHGNSVTVIGHIGKMLVMHEVNPNSIGQFSGLSDRSGREIYEADIVKFRHSSEPEYNLEATVVEWVPQWCRFCIDGNSGLNANMNLEIIGNRYENPDLLEHGGDWCSKCGLVELPADSPYHHCDQCRASR